MAPEQKTPLLGTPEQPAGLIEPPTPEALLPEVIKPTDQEIAADFAAKYPNTEAAARLSEEAKSLAAPAHPEAPVTVPAAETTPAGYPVTGKPAIDIVPATQPRASFWKCLFGKK